MPVAQTLSEGRSIRFGPFELNLHTAELSKNGLKLKLQGQPVKVLALLLEKPGQLISREEIRQHLWPADTFVDFEHNLNTDIKRLREVLGDEADMPRYIETLRGRGYRFIGEIERDNPPQGVPAPTVGVVSPLALANETEQEAGKRSRLWKWSPVALGLLILGTVAATYIFNPPSTLRIVATRRLTRTPFNKGDTGGRYSAIVTDGARIYFRENRAGRWGISEVSTMGGDVSPIPSSYDWLYIQDISPDLSELLIADNTFRDPSPRLWIAPLPTGPARQIPGVIADWSLFAPNGRGILYTSPSNINKDLYRADNDGGNSRRLLSVSNMSCPRISPDGGRMRFTVAPDARTTAAIWEVRMDGSNAHPLFADQPGATACGVWSPDGKLYAFHRWDGLRWNLWAVREGGNWLGFRKQQPVQLTPGPLNYHPSTFSRDGKALYSVGEDARGELAAYSRNSNQSVPYLPGISASYVQISPDGQWVAYVLYPQGTLWRSRIDGSERTQLTFPPIVAMFPRWSPDGKLIAFSDMLGDASRKIYLIPAEGGSPMLLLAGAFGPTDPTWSPDGLSIAYGGCAITAACAERSEVRIFDLKTQRSRSIPGSQDFFSPRWSPDGKHLIAQSGDIRALWLFSFADNAWAKLASADRNIGGPEWSRDSRYVYANRDDEAIVRIDISNHHVELALQVKDIPRTGWWGGYWFGITQDEKILVLRNTGSEDLYAFDLEYQQASSEPGH